MSEPSQKAKLDGLLEDWHRWSSKTELVSAAGKCAMFAQAQSPRHWDSTGDIDDAQIQQSTMDAIDFAILGDRRGQGGMTEPHRTAVTFYARNLASKVSVWHSPRLPADQLERMVIVNQGLDLLVKKLRTAGVL
jgi:hypothetical protein